MKQKIRKIENSYDIGKIRSHKSLTGGLDAHTYLICSAKNKYVAKIFSKRQVNQEIHFEMNLLKRLELKRFPAPRIILMKNNKTILFYKNSAILLYSFIKGKKIEKIRKHHLSHLTKTMAFLHSIEWKIHSKHKKDSIDPDQIRDRIAQAMKKHENAFLLHQVIEFLPKKIPNLPKGIVHLDLHHGNVIFGKGKVNGFIDFGEANYAPYIFDIAVSLIAFCFKNQGLNYDLTRHIINEYETHRKLTTKEKKFLYHSIILMALWHISSNIDKYPKNDGTWKIMSSLVNIIKILKREKKDDFLINIFYLDLK